MHLTVQELPCTVLLAHKSVPVNCGGVARVCILQYRSINSCHAQYCLLTNQLLTPGT